VSTGPPAASAWDSPPLGQPPADGVIEPPKKSRGWRKNRAAEADAAAATAATAAAAGHAAPGAFAPMEPPAGPPVDPVPLNLANPLPPPPPDSATRGPVVWKPPIDPVSGQPVWDQPPQPVETPPKKRGWGRGAKAGTVAAAGAAGAVVGAEGAGSLPGAVSSSSTPGSGYVPAASGATPPTAASPFNLAPPVGSSPPKKNRTLVGVLVVILVLAVGGIAYLLVKNHDNNSTPTTAATTPVPSQSVADKALAASVNLRLTDLPSGWTRVAANPAVPAPSATAQLQAQRTLASCLGQPVAVVAGLFGSGRLPGQSGTAASPTFQSGSDAGIQMASTTEVLATVADTRALTAPFGSPKFVTCFTQYQSALAAASVTGATATVTPVTLTAPTGVTTFAYLTTVTIPGKGSEVKGQAFIFGGRIGTLLAPTTNGPPVPQTDFAMAYDSITARISQDLGK
jgi:hypothetical protein